MEEITIRMRPGDVARILGIMDSTLKEFHEMLVDIEKNREEIPLWLTNEIADKTRIIRALEKGLQQREPARKEPPVDRGKLLIGLECCRDAECDHCPYDSETFENCNQVAFDALAYIGYLEERLEEAEGNG